MWGELMDDNDRKSDRRRSEDSPYEGLERREGNRRSTYRVPAAQPTPGSLSDIDLVRAYQRSNGRGSSISEQLLAEIERRGLDL